MSLHIGKRGNSAITGAYAVPKTRLTELSVKNAQPTETQYVLWDATPPSDRFSRKIIRDVEMTEDEFRTFL